PPTGQFPRDPWRPSLDREIEDDVGRGPNRVLVALKPRGLRPRRRDRSRLLQPAARLRDLLRFVERVPDSGVAAPGTQKPEHTESLQDGNRDRRPRFAQDESGRVGRILPTPLVKRDAGLVADEVPTPQLKVAFAAILEPRVEILERNVVQPLPCGRPDEVDVGAPNG